MAIDAEIAEMINHSKTFVSDDGYVMMDAHIIEELARTIAAQHYMLISSGSESPDDPRLLGQAGVAMILIELVQAIAAKHADEISALKAGKTDLDKELKNLLGSDEEAPEGSSEEDLTDDEQ